MMDVDRVKGKDCVGVTIIFRRLRVDFVTPTSLVSFMIGFAIPTTYIGIDIMLMQFQIKIFVLPKENGL